MLNKILFHAVSNFFSLSFVPGNTDKHPLRQITRAAYRLTLKTRVFLTPRRIAPLKKQRINRKKYAPKPKIMDIESYVVVITTSEENVPIGRNALTCTSIQRY